MLWISGFRHRVRQSGIWHAAEYIWASPVIGACMISLLKTTISFSVLSGAAQQAALMMYKPWPQYSEIWVGTAANIIALSIPPMIFGMTVGFVARRVFVAEETELRDAGSTSATLAIAAFTVAALLDISL